MQGDGQFPSTQWTLVDRIKSPDEAVAAEALDEICTRYHYPLYCYLRRRGCDHHDAEDVLHDFLVRLLRRQALERLDESKGKLRGYLAMAVGRHLLRWQETKAKRREIPANLSVSLDFPAIAIRYRSDSFPADESPDRLFERKWATEMLYHTISKLERIYREKNKAALFALLRPALEAGGSLRGENLSGLAAAAGLSEPALRTAMSRLLQEFRATIHEEVRSTVEHADEVPQELAYLMGLFRRE